MTEMCDLCNNRFYDKQTLSRHYKNIHLGIKPKKYKCNVCGNEQINPTNFKEHMLVHQQGYAFKCSFCPKTMNSKNMFKKHNCRKIIKRKGYCGNCSACRVEVDCDKCVRCLDKPRNGGQNKYKKKCVNKICMEQRTKSDQNKCECGSCAKNDCGECPPCASKPKFGGEKSLRKRCDLKICDWKKANIDGKVIKNKDPKVKKVYNCDQCIKVYSYLSQLKSHKLTGHNEVKESMKKKVCDLCNKRFGYNQTLRIHQQQIHFGIPRPQFKCDICGKEKYSKTYLNWHLLIHKQGYAFKCSFCLKTFNTRKATKRHSCQGMKTVNSQEVQIGEVGKNVRDLKENNTEKNFNLEKVPKVYKCDQCEKIYPYLSKLKKHKLTGHNHAKEAAKKKVCNLCNKRFSYNQTLRSHQEQMHFGIPRPEFKCEICGKEKYSKTYLDTHLLVHKQGYAYKCSFCDKTFNTRKAIKYHIIKEMKKIDQEVVQTDEVGDSMFNDKKSPLEENNIDFGSNFERNTSIEVAEINFDSTVDMKDFDSKINMEDDSYLAESKNTENERSFNQSIDIKDERSFDEQINSKYDASFEGNMNLVDIGCSVEKINLVPDNNVSIERSEQIKFKKGSSFVEEKYNENKKEEKKDNEVESEKGLSNENNFKDERKVPNKRSEFTALLESLQTQFDKVRHEVNRGLIINTGSVEADLELVKHMRDKVFKLEDLIVSDLLKDVH